MRFFYLSFFLSISMIGYSQKKENPLEGHVVFAPPGLQTPKDTNFAVSILPIGDDVFLINDTSLSPNQRSNLTLMNLMVYVGETNELLTVIVRCKAKDTTMAFGVNFNLVHKMVDGKHYLFRGHLKYEVVNKIVMIPEMFPFGKLIEIDAVGDFNIGSKKYFRTNF